jgi:hypothetical protein
VSCAQAIRGSSNGTANSSRRRMDLSQVRLVSG